MDLEVLDRCVGIAIKRGFQRTYQVPLDHCRSTFKNKNVKLIVTEKRKFLIIFSIQTSIKSERLGSRGT